MMQNSNLYRRFSLVELLASITIIGLLMAMIIGGSTFARRQGTRAKTMAQLKQMEIALESYRQDHGYYPQQEAAQIQWTNFVHSDTRRPYLEGYTGGDYTDAWGRAFWYQCPGTMQPQKYDIWSLGPDGKHGDGGSTAAAALVTTDNDDVTNWKME